MHHRHVLIAALFFAALADLPSRTCSRAADFTATQIKYNAIQGTNDVLVTWNDSSPSPGNVSIKSGATVIATVAGSTGANSHTLVNLPTGQVTLSASSAAAGSLGSQVQTVIDDHAPLFGNPSALTCDQQENEGDCEIIIDWETGTPVPSQYDVLLDGGFQFSQEPFPLGAVISNATAGEHCTSVVSTMELGPGEFQGRYRGETVESCCTITCGATVCSSPVELVIGQVAYGAGPTSSAVIASWKLPPEGPYAVGIKTFVNGAEKGTIAGDSTRTRFDGLAQGTYELAVQGDCGEPSGLSGKPSNGITLKTETPHTNPLASAVVCDWNPETQQTTATWTNADPSNSIDVYLVHGGARSYAMTVPGDAVQVTLDGTQPSDGIELQFFAFSGQFLYGSTPVACETSGGGNQFIAGVCNGAGTKPDISSAIFGLNYLFVGGRAPPCLKACQLNQGDRFDLSDMVYLLDYLFRGGPPPVSWGGPNPTCSAAPADECGASNEGCPI